MFKLEFHKNQSKNYNKAVQYAKLLPGSTIYHNKVEITLEPYRVFSAYEDLAPLLAIIQNWKSTKAYWNDKQVHPYRFIFETYKRVFECSIRRNSPEHCFHMERIGWTCKHLIKIKRYIDQPGKIYFYNFGKFVNGYWQIDKEKLYNELIKEANEKHLTMCPFFSPDALKIQIDTLPDEIIPEFQSFRMIYKNGIGVNIRHIKHKSKYPSYYGFSYN
jgi:hypothetical protein